jgi:hypothetical protein
VTAGAHDNLIEGNWIGSNGNHGISLNGTVEGSGLLPSHHNTVTHNYIGTNPAGDDLGNDNKGIIIQRGSRDNYIFDNMIAYNQLHGVYLYGGDGYPPQDNRIISNTVTMNEQISDPFHYQKRGAVVCDRTHSAVSNTIPTESSGFDNIIASNVISGNPTAGIYNVGASPLISGNRIINNQDTTYGYGIYNIVDFGASMHPDNYADDILSVPYIVNNVVDGNSNVGILSLDTAPARRYELVTTLNNAITTTGSDQVRQSWYVGVEVLTGTITHTVPITQDAAVRILKGDQTDAYELGYNDEIADSAIWLDNPLATYTNTEKWPQAVEFSVNTGGTLDSWMTHTLKITLPGYTGTVLFPFDGLTETKPLSDYEGLPNYRVTGPYARYQIGEVNFAADTDNDGISDPVEGGDQTDTDGDGTPDYQDPDSDGDGIPDSEEGGSDTDGDGTPDFQDSDSDGDGIPDSEEAGDDPTNPVDSDGDGTPDFQDPDSDGDGIPDSEEAGDNPENPVDSDGDGIPDYQDPDSDGDGIPDSEEAGDDPENPVDSDGDGIPDYQDPDSDNDGIPDSEEAGDNPENPVDSDGDGTPDYLDDDSDDDGIPDSEEAGDDPENPVDTDNDGIPDYLDDDSDNDGVPDSVEAGDDPTDPQDSDGDGIPDYIDADDDGDGVDTIYENPDPNDNGDPSDDAQDTDGDGIPDYLDDDDDGDGTPTEDEQPDPNDDGNPEDAVDSDGDGTADYLDPHYYIYLPLVNRSFGAASQ